MEGSNSQAIEELYLQYPGLTCRAIARRLGLQEALVCRCLGYPPPPTQAATCPERGRRAARIQTRRSCPRCGATKIAKNGSSRTGKRVWRCSVCGKQFVEFKEGVLISATCRT